MAGVGGTPVMGMEEDCMSLGEGWSPLGADWVSM
jgi:hypothetical protein